MANEFARGVKDAAHVVTRALTAADGNVTSSDLDLGSGDYLTENIELSIEIPELDAAELASADTLTIDIQAGDSATPTTSIIRHIITGTGSTIAAQELRFRLPSNCGQYVNVKFTTAGTTGDMSDKTVTISLRF